MSQSANKNNKKSKEELLDQTFGFYEDTLPAKEKINVTKSLPYLKQYSWVFLLILGIAGLLLLSKSLDLNNANNNRVNLACAQTNTVEEILASNKNYVQVKMNDGQIVNFPPTMSVTKNEQVCVKYVQK